MDADYLSQTPSYFDNDPPFMETFQVTQYPSPEEELQRFDMPHRADYETSPWFQFEDGTSPSSSSPESYYQDTNPSSMPTTSGALKPSAIKPRDPEISRQNRRRAQNRQSQRQFRERKQKAYDEVVGQLHSQSTLISALRAENAMLNLQMDGLRREKQGALEAVVRFVQSIGFSGTGPGSGHGEGREEAMGIGAAEAERGDEGIGDLRQFGNMGV